MPTAWKATTMRMSRALAVRTGGTTVQEAAHDDDDPNLMAWEVASDSEVQAVLDVHVQAGLGKDVVMAVES